MAIRIKSRGGESAEQMLRRFKKLCEKEGLTKDIKRKEYYEKPSDRNRREARKSVTRRMREAGLLPMPLKAGKGGKGGKGGPGGPGGFGGGGGGGGFGGGGGGGGFGGGYGQN
jgi:small subunit ribosomal protein S21